MEANTIEEQDTQMQDERTLDLEDEEQAAERCAGGVEYPLDGGVEMESVYNIKFPLPEQTDPELCRDEFLKNVLEQYKTKVEKKTRSQRSRELTFIGLDGPEKTLEALAIKEMIRRSRMSSRGTTVVSIIQRRTTRLYEITLECQKASVDFMLPRLRKQLGLFSNPWPGEINNMPNKLFHWSVDHFMQRLHINQLYLDVIQRERTKSDLDCIKFRTDLHEIISLLQEVRDDFIEGRDICDYSMKLIHAAKYTTNPKWVHNFNMARQLQEELKYNSFTNRGSKNYRRSSDNRQSGMKIDFEHQQAVGPIDLRYRINWMRSCSDQVLMRLQGREELLQTELTDIRTHMRQDALVHNNSEYVYAYLIDSFKNKIKDWEEKLETDMEKAELMCNQTSNMLQKVKDDFVFYRDQQEMFKRRIIEVRAQIEQEERDRIEEAEIRATAMSLKLLNKQNKRRGKDKKKKF
ncbi:uncharacterized protein LOC108164296 [Drosophila miranda]|uniref:uncharacterized protein LOC108164296 n=1 Tax=Drosophila miranda TaxID=7229 RepID=UPI0007E70362|nr:uncharacterized protein LOC108164296 [Drosophila miranda]